MFDRFVYFRRMPILVLLGFSIFLAACGGGGSSGPEGPGTGTVALLLTDMPSEELDEINLTVVEAILIGGEGQQELFSDADNPIKIDLLDLENFSLPIAFEDVPAGEYTKLRLRISDLLLVEYVPDGPDAEYRPALPANGKIDLLHPGGFEVLPGRTLVIELDMDANKSFHIVETGNSKYRMRPVVFVEISNTGAPDKLARIDGVIDEVIDPGAGSFVLCSSTDADTCIDVSLTDDGCIYDADGLQTDPTALGAGQDAVAIGRYSRMGNDLMLDAIVVEQGDAQQFQGTVSGLPDEAGTFLMVDGDGKEFTVELQEGCTQVLGPDGAIIGPDGLLLDQRIEVEGVIPADSDGTLLRAALVIVAGDDTEEQQSGKITATIDEPSFVMATSGGDITVVLQQGASIMRRSTDMELSGGDFGDVQEGRSADTYGKFLNGAFEASSIIIDTGD